MYRSRSAPSEIPSDGSSARSKYAQQGAQSNNVADRYPQDAAILQKNDSRRTTISTTLPRRDPNHEIKLPPMIDQTNRPPTALTSESPLMKMAWILEYNLVVIPALGRATTASMAV